MLRKVLKGRKNKMKTRKKIINEKCALYIQNAWRSKCSILRLGKTVRRRHRFLEKI
jgi:hypothetical protein